MPQRKYWTLFMRARGRWTPVFGAAASEAVSAEREKWIASRACARADLKIVETLSRGKAVLAAQSQLNKSNSSGRP